MRAMELFPPSWRAISLSQSVFINRIVSNFGQIDAHPVDTPVATGLQLLRPDKSELTSPSIASWIEHTPYCSLIGSLNYLAVATRPDIAFAVGRLAIFLDNFRPEQWEATTHVVCYLKCTKDLWYDAVCRGIWQCPGQIWLHQDLIFSICCRDQL
jgi:hypothetical protein